MLANLTIDSCEAENFLCPCVKQLCHETYYPYFYGNRQYQSMCDEWKKDSTLEIIDQFDWISPGPLVVKSMLDVTMKMIG